MSRGEGAMTRKIHRCGVRNHEERRAILFDSFLVDIVLRCYSVDLWKE